MDMLGPAEQGAEEKSENKSWGCSMLLKKSEQQIIKNVSNTTF